MRSRSDPLKWPFAIGLTFACLLAGIFLVPVAWFDFFFSPLDLREFSSLGPEKEWLVLVPPPDLEVQQESLSPTKVTVTEETVVQDPDWWTSGWRIRISNEAVTDLKPAPLDSVAVVLQALGVGLDFTRKALPDSLLNHQLMLLRIEDSFAFEELKPYLSAMTRARAYADMKSREADMYDEHLSSQIMVPD